MAALKKIETGVPGLDTLTLGGIPEGRSTLITGKSGTGKTVVAMQIDASTRATSTSAAKLRPATINHRLSGPGLLTLSALFIMACSSVVSSPRLISSANNSRRRGSSCKRTAR